MTNIIHRLACTSLGVLVLATPALAQDPSPERTLFGLAGRSITIVDSRGAEVRGRVVGIDRHDVVLGTSGTTRRVALADIERIDRYGDNPFDMAVLGAGLAGMLSVFVWEEEARCRRTVDCDYKPADHLTLGESGAMALGFATIGLAVDLLHRGRTSVWLAPVAVPVPPAPALRGVRPTGSAAPALMLGYRRTF